MDEAMSEGTGNDRSMICRISKLKISSFMEWYEISKPTAYKNVKLNDIFRNVIVKSLSQNMTSLKMNIQPYFQKFAYKFHVNYCSAHKQINHNRAWSTMKLTTLSILLKGQKMLMQCHLARYILLSCPEISCTMNKNATAIIVVLLRQKNTEFGQQCLHNYYLYTMHAPMYVSNTYYKLVNIGFKVVIPIVRHPVMASRST